MRLVLKDLIRRRWWLALAVAALIWIGLWMSSTMQLGRLSRFVMLPGMLLSGVSLGLITGMLDQYFGANRILAALPVRKKSLARLAWSEYVAFPVMAACVFFLISLVSPRTSWAVWPDAVAFFCTLLFTAGLMASVLLVLPPHKQRDRYWKKVARIALICVIGWAYLSLIETAFERWFSEFSRAPLHKNYPGVLLLGCSVSIALVVVSWFRFGLPVYRTQSLVEPLWKKKGKPRFFLGRPWVWLHLERNALLLGSIFIVSCSFQLGTMKYVWPEPLAFLLKMPVLYWVVCAGLVSCMAFAPPTTSMRVLRTLPISGGRLTVVLGVLPCAACALILTGAVFAAALLGLFGMAPPYIGPVLFALATGALLNVIILIFLHHPVVLVASAVAFFSGTIRLFIARHGEDGPLVGGLGTPAFWICSALLVFSLAVSLFVLRRAIERHGVLYRGRSAFRSSLEP